MTRRADNAAEEGYGRADGKTVVDGNVVDGTVEEGAGREHGDIRDHRGRDGRVRPMTRPRRGHAVSWTAQPRRARP